MVFVEQRNGQLRRASLEALSEAERLSQITDSDLSVILISSDGSTLAGSLNKFGVKTILLVEHANFADYATEAYAAAFSEAVKKVSPKYVFAANTALAKDLIPRVAARFDSPCITDVVGLKVEEGKILATKPVYSGKALARFESDSDIAFFTLRPNIFALSEGQNGAQVTIEKLLVPDCVVRAKVIETHANQGEKRELTETAIIVSGGRGIKGPENWAVLQSLCDVLGAALGASRAVVDAGWIDHQHQVGQTGKTVSPQLYIACGISGAIQHLAGMSTSKVIVAINKDPDAPIFKIANYGLVGDCLEIVPKMTEEFRRLKVAD